MTREAMSWWQIVSAILVPLLPLAGFSAWFVRTTVNSAITTMRLAITEANAVQMIQLEGKYTHAMTSAITGAQIESLLQVLKTDFARAEARFMELYQYAHGNFHDLNGSALKHEGKLGELTTELAALRGEMNMLNQYAHVSKHDLDGDIAGLTKQLEFLAKTGRGKD